MIPEIARVCFGGRDHIVAARSAFVDRAGAVTAGKALRPILTRFFTCSGGSVDLGVYLIRQVP